MSVPLASRGLTALAVAAMLVWACLDRPSLAADASAPATAVATFAGGCLWCMQPPFDALDGVVKTTVGYTGGARVDPTDDEVAAGTTGHTEAIEIVYDPARISYGKLLDVFWHNIDPLARDGKACGHGAQHRIAIFYHDDDQRTLAEASKAALEAGGRLAGAVATQIIPAGPFYAAAEEQQAFYKRNPQQYTFFVVNCGRDAALRAAWGSGLSR